MRPGVAILFAAAAVQKTHGFFVARPVVCRGRGASIGAGVAMTLQKQQRAPAAAAAAAAEDDALEVWDAEGATSWKQFKADSPEAAEVKLTAVDEMNCFETDECPTPEGKFTKNWNQVPYKAAVDKETYTVFDGDSEYEKEKPWAERWFNDVGENDLAAEGYANAKEEQYDI